jgi:hypothetical protein
MRRLRCDIRCISWSISTLSSPPEEGILSRIYVSYCMHILSVYQFLHQDNLQELNNIGMMTDAVRLVVQALTREMGHGAMDKAQIKKQVQLLVHGDGKPRSVGSLERLSWLRSGH